ncbi:serine/threonine-protein kinase Nek3 isoform X2 [Conger conger]|uniref:serine/threonine-protein kinase Nek3 isoform X2 n=1 Tax=Conger conger TaxID=82655 RepID=UPI002A5B0683|nr:serine/threonine-protein kinase Nek3 isoform X2 [Conger conger]
MDSYTVLRVIGEGSFGRALLAHPKDDSGHYVIKEIRLPKTQSGQDGSRTEAVLLSRMKHANIVAFREAFEAEGHLYIVMEYCTGGDLLQRIKQQRNTQFSVDVILRWFAQMCLGAKHVHDKRVLHRDLKSKNIFLTDNGTVKLGDFGSACVLNSSKAYAYSYVGTPYYVSPEIWDGKPYNNKSDVWSLGCVLYELCTLRHPFQARSWKSLILKVCRGAYPPLPSRLPYELHYLLKQMFRTNPRDRPSLNTILTSHRIAKLLQKHLPAQQLQEEAPSRWKKEEGEKVAMFLGQKSLIQTMSSLGGSTQEAQERPRRNWAVGPPNTLMQFLGNADLISSSSMALESGFESSSGGSIAETERASPRRQWDRGTPERLLSLLDKACQSLASRTYTVHKEGAEHPLMGPLSQKGADSPDGAEEEEDEEEESRLEPRSDDEDTDFEEDCPCDLVEELEKMVMEP